MKSESCTDNLKVDVIPEPEIQQDVVGCLMSQPIETAALSQSENGSEYSPGESEGELHQSQNSVVEDAAIEKPRTFLYTKTNLESFVVPIAPE